MGRPLGAPGGGRPGPTPIGRPIPPPIGREVGCIGRRSPGRSGGRDPGPPGPWGRGRWKIGCPRTGAPVRGAGGAGVRCGGAVYTGRGPVWGTIKRRGGAPPCAGPWGFAGCAGAFAAGAAGAAGFSAAGTTGFSIGAAGASTWAAGGAATAGSTGCSIFSGATGLAGSATLAAGFSTFDGGITTAAGRATVCGVMIRGVLAGVSGLGGSAAGGAAGFSAAGAVGFTTTVFAGAAGFGGSATGLAAAGRGGAGWAACSFSSVMAFSTSPGLEIFERSIFGFGSSCFEAFAGAWPPWPANHFFTRSASSASIELECVFFSVIPTFGSASRISLLLTSSSLARSLIRIFIRPLISSVVPPLFRGPQ